MTMFNPSVVFSVKHTSSVEALMRRATASRSPAWTSRPLSRTSGVVGPCSIS